MNAAPGEPDEPPGQVWFFLFTLAIRELEKADDAATLDIDPPDAARQI